MIFHYLLQSEWNKSENWDATGEIPVSVPSLEIDVPVSSLTESQKGKVLQIRAGIDPLTDDPRIPLCVPMYRWGNEDFCLHGPWHAPDSVIGLCAAEVLQVWEDDWQAHRDVAERARADSIEGFRRQAKAFKKSVSVPKQSFRMELPQWCTGIFESVPKGPAVCTRLRQNAGGVKAEYRFYFTRDFAGRCIVVANACGRDGLQVTYFYDVLEALQFSLSKEYAKEIFKPSFWMARVANGDIDQDEADLLEQALDDAARHQSQRRAMLEAV